MNSDRIMDLGARKRALEREAEQVQKARQTPIMLIILSLVFSLVFLAIATTIKPGNVTQFQIVLALVAGAFVCLHVGILWNARLEEKGALLNEAYKDVTTRLDELTSPLKRAL